MSKDVGLYLHIPFCARKCAYCDFASYAGREGDMGRYIDCLISEMQTYPRDDYRISTLFLGGGTPSLLPPALMDELLTAVRDHFSFVPNAECSCECNPGTVSPDLFRVLKSQGINRLSFGVQAVQPHLLSLLGRIHSWDDARRSVMMAKEAGFDNINLDMMLGLPGQTLDDVRQTLDAFLSLSPTHLSCYGLIVEEGTLLHRQVEKKLWQLPEEDDERAMYDLCLTTLEKHGFEHYEISNFALPGLRCRHNADCWQRKEYIGLGCAASGFLGNKRWQNPPSLDAYLAHQPGEITLLSPEDAMFESLMLGLRMMDGVSADAFFRMHGVTLDSIYGKKLKKPISQGLIAWQDGYLRLTRRGMDMQNAVLVELL